MWTEGQGVVVGSVGRMIHKSPFLVRPPKDDEEAGDATADEDNKK